MMIKGVCTNCKDEMVFETGRAADIRCASCGSSIRMYESEDGSSILQARCLKHEIPMEVPTNTPFEACHTSSSGKCWKIIFEYSLKKAERQRFTKGDRKKNRTAIIILCWNKSRYTKACIRSIRQFTRPEEYRLIVVDNGSTDDTTSFLQEVLLNDDLLLYLPRNVGFAKGNNMALRNVIEEPYVLFLNNDTQVKESGWLSGMIRTLRRRKLDMVGPMCGRCWVHRTVNTNKLIYSFEAEVDDPMDELGYIEGWCLLGKRNSIKKLRGFDEIFSPAYCEDSDLSWRAKQKGMKLGKVRDVPIIHYRGKTSDQLESVPALGEEMGAILYRRWADDKTIVLRRAGAIGDVLMTTPIIRHMKEKFPDSEILLATDCPQLVQGNPYLHGVIPYKQDTGLDGFSEYHLQYEEEPGENAIEVMAEQAGLDPKEISLKMDCFLGKEKDPVPRMKADLSNVVVFHTGRSWKNREWHIDKFARLARWLIEVGFLVVEIGDGRTQSMQLGLTGKSLDFRKKTWEQSAWWIRKATFFVGIDSAPANVAKAVGTPAFIIYGCTDPETRKAEADEYPLVVEGLSCAGCRNRTKASSVSCTNDRPRCVEDLQVAKVKEEIEKNIQIDKPRLTERRRVHAAASSVL